MFEIMVQMISLFSCELFPTNVFQQANMVNWDFDGSFVFPTKRNYRNIQILLFFMISTILPTCEADQFSLIVWIALTLSSLEQDSNVICCRCP